MMAPPTTKSPIIMMTMGDEKPARASAGVRIPRTSRAARAVSATMSALTLPHINMATVITNIISVTVMLYFFKIYILLFFIFPRDYERYQRYLQDDAKIFVIGHATVEDEQNGKIICERIIPFDELPKQLWLRFDTMEDYKKNESRLLETIRESDGGDEVIIYIADTKQMKELGRNYSVNANNELMEQLLEFLDKENAKIVEKNIEKMC